MARHLLASYRCVNHLLLGPQCSAPEKWEGQGGPEGDSPAEPQTSPAQPGDVSGGRVSVCLPAFGALVLKVWSGFLSLSLSLLLTLTPLIVLKGVISFLSSCHGMTPEKTYQKRRSRIGAETPGMGEARLQPLMVVSLASCPGWLARPLAGCAELIYF